MFQPNFDVITTFVAERLHGLAEDALALVRAVGLGGVEERHAPVVGGAEDADHLRAVRHRGLVSAGHVLHADPDARHLERAEPTPARGHGRRRPARVRRLGERRQRDPAKEGCGGERAR
jgi:hypothetical protein